MALLLVYIISPDERTTRLAVRHDDALRLWLNGSEIVRPGKIPFLNDHDLINEDETHAAIHLKAGVNILLAAVAETCAQVFRNSEKKHRPHEWWFNNLNWCIWSGALVDGAPGLQARYPFTKGGLSITWRISYVRKIWGCCNGKPG